MGNIIWLKSSIWENRARSIYLILLLPLIVALSIFLVLYYSYGEINNQLITEFTNINIVWLPIIWIWLFLWILFQRQIIFSFSGAVPIERKNEPEIYNIVENLCISRWLPVPKIWIIEDDSLNAFATWWTPKNSWIVFSRWILNTLDKNEIEAVAWHELTHIMNGDIKIMVLTNVFIWIIWTIGEILMRMKSSSSDSKNNNPLPLLWLVLYLLSLLIFPLINLAISRKREFLADAGSVELTKNPNALISALQKISQNPFIESIEKDNISAMCIEYPKPKKSSFFSDLFSTHPSIEKRIEQLRMY